MSIPNPFRPVCGGANPLAGYVTDGLILCFDALLETPGTKNSLTNWASGRSCLFSTPITISEGVITAEKLSLFNEPPCQPIEGHAAVGVDYSADICAQKLPTATGSSISCLVWDDNKVANFFSIGFQVHNGPQGIRQQVNAAGGMPIKAYPLADGEKVSVHMEYEQDVGDMRINGQSVGQLIMDNAGVDGALVRLNTGAKLFAYRLYNRRLTVAEQKQNYDMDKKRFNLT